MNILYSHPDYQELELSTKPKFKVGDWITNDTWTHCIQSISDGFYHFLEGGHLDFGKIDGYYRLWSIEDAKDGDVLVYQDEIFLFNLVDSNLTKSISVLYYCCFDGNLVVHSFYGFSNEELLHVHPATKEQRGLLFQKMKESGYQWDANKKKLNKILKHYDISSFYAGMPVLVRDTNNDEWNYLYFSHYRKKMPDHFFAGGNPWYECIPFNKETKHLLGTTDMCEEKYINW
jgi:hypothetical protein